MRLRDGDPPAPTLALVAGVALHETASLHGAEVQLKWPNDLLSCSPAKAGGQASGAAGLPKLAGILLERHEQAVVIGCGANLAHHPQDLDRPATSLAALTGTAPDPQSFVEHLAEIFARHLARWRAEGLRPLIALWLRSAHPLGTALSTPEGEGLFDGLDETGALRLRLADGTSRVIHAGDVFLI